MQTKSTTVSSRPSARRGISLLEVLLAIGILSIGLLSVLALLPAGRTFVVQAERDDRVAAIVPDALATMEAQNLFAENSLEWRSVQTDFDERLTNPAELAAERPEWRLPPEDRQWTKVNPDLRRAQRTDFWGREGLDVTVSGDVPADAVKEDGVTLTQTRNGLAFENPAPGSVKEDGSWLIGLTFPVPEGDRFQSHYITTGANAGSIDTTKPPPWDDYNFTVTYRPAAPGQPTPVVNLSPASHRVYGHLRAKDLLYNDAEIDIGLATVNRLNEDPDSAVTVDFAALDDEVLSVGTIRKLRMVRNSEIQVRGQIWRFDVGRFVVAEGHEEERWFDRRDHETPLTLSTKWPSWTDPTANPGPLRVASSNIDTPEDKDFYKLSVRKGYEVAVNWSNTSIHTRAILDQDIFRVGHEIPRPDPEPHDLFPLRFEGPGGTAFMQQIPSLAAANEMRYSVPNDGVVTTGVGLAGGVFPVGHPRAGQRITNTVQYTDPLHPQHPSNEAYSFRFSIYRPDRMIAIDPLMATYLDKTIGESGMDIASHPLANNRRYFAQFEQAYTGDPTNPRAFVIPRLNWLDIAKLADFDAAIAVAERLCRLEDLPTTQAAGSDDDAPSPEFDRVASTTGAADPNGLPLRRQSAGRYTWMLTVQPENPGSVHTNWRAGQPFETSIVVFEDRPLPKDGVFRGEYAFEAGWSDADGMLHVRVPRAQSDGVVLADEDIKRLFASGSWLLLGPRVVLSAAPITDDMALEWIKIRSSEFEQRGTDVVARVLLDREPARNVLLRPETLPVDPLRLDPDGRLRVMALAYEGVVAVVKRTMVVKDPR